MIADVPPRRVLVVGTGLIGTSVGLALVAAGWQVWLDDVSAERVRLAAAMGAGEPADQRDGAAVDVVIVAAPPTATPELACRALRTELEATVTHVSSVQANLQRDVESAGGDMTRFVGGHPVAGRERSGPAAAARSLFAGRPWVVCPTAVTDAGAVGDVERLARDCAALPVVMDAKRHDELLARLSHTPQLVASALAASLGAVSRDDVALSGSGLRDTTRIADSDPRLWREIVSSNAAPVARAVREVAARLDGVADALDRSPTAGAAAVEELLQAGRAGRAALPGKHGDRDEAWAVVDVVLPDRAGALARLLADVAATGTNLEDLWLEHAPGEAVGVAQIAVSPAAARALVGALTDRGWTCTETARG